MVAGGCRGGTPVLPAEGPGVFAGSPSAEDIAVRDRLVTAQEALLNAYRCRFGIDTRIVPDGCPTVAPPPEPSAEDPDVFAGVGSPSAEDIAAAEVAMLELVNSLRTEKGLEQLTYDQRMVRVAREWSQEMAETGDFRHNPSYSQQYPFDWRSAGENIAQTNAFEGVHGWEGALNAAVVDAFELLVDSPGHYANMVSPYFDHLGVGVAVGEIDADGYTRVYITQNFATIITGSTR